VNFCDVSLDRLGGGDVRATACRIAALYFRYAAAVERAGILGVLR
jgi:hypothetical protein